MTAAVITGFGVVSALGHGRRATAEALRDGRCGVGPIRSFDAGAYRSGVAAEVNEDPSARAWACALHHESDLPWFGDRLGRTARFASWALAEAMSHAGLSRTDLDPARTGLVLGGCTAGMPEGEGTVLDADPEAAWPPPGAARALLSIPVAGTLDVLAHQCDVRGPTLLVSTACSSATHAFGHALRWIRSGRCDRVLVGGADAFCRLTHAGFNALGLVDPERPRPFDARRQGMVIGEGAALFVVESEPTARARGVSNKGWLAGTGGMAEGWHIVQPRPDGSGAALAMRRALADAGLSASDIEYVNAHGTGTTHNDAAEALAHHAVFGARAPRVPCSSSKSQFGHLLGASGAVEAAAVLLGMDGGFLPPTASWAEADPAIDLDVVPGVARAGTYGWALSNSFAFGGNNASVVLGHPSQRPRETP